MKFFGINVATGFPNPANANEARFLAMCQCILCVADIVASFDYDGVASATIVSIQAFQTRFVHLSCLLLLVALGPNYSPMGWVARSVAIYGVGNPIVPCGGAQKLFSQLIATFMMSVSLVTCLLLGPKSIMTIASASILLFFSLMDAILGFCFGCWMYNVACDILNIDNREEFTTKELLHMYSGWPIIGCLSVNVVEFRKSLLTPPPKELEETKQQAKRKSSTTKWVAITSEDGVSRLVRKNDDDESAAAAATTPDDHGDIESSIKKSKKEEETKVSASTDKWVTVCEGGVCRIKKKDCSMDLQDETTNLGEDEDFEV